MTLRSTRLRDVRPEATEEIGYTPGWDLIAAVDRHGRSVARVVSFVPDRALIVFDERHPPTWFEGELVFPADSGLGPVKAHQVGPVSRHLAGDHTASVEIVGTPLAVARLQLAWLRARLSRGEVLPPVTRHAQFEPIGDPERVARILAMLRGMEAPVTVQGSGGDDAPIVRGRMDRDGNLLLPWDRMTRLTPPLRVWACGYNSTYEIVWPDTPAFGAGLRELVRVRRRTHRRVAAPPRITVELEHPIWPELAAVRPVVDLSVDGLAFRTDTAADALFPGLALTVVVDWKRGRRYRFRAIVRHCTPGRGRACDTCGVSLHPADQLTADEWRAELEPLLHPTTHTAPRAADLWDLYRESGYFRLSEKSPAEFDPLQRAFTIQRARIARHPDVGVDIGYHVGGELQCVVSQIEAWSGSWLIHQGARRAAGRPLAAAGDDVLRDAYMHAYEHILARPEARHFVTYVQEVARFSRRSHYDLATRLAAKGDASVTPFRAIEMSVRLVHPPAIVPGIAIATATACERELVAHAIARERPALLVEGTGLSGRRLDLGAVATRWQAAGLQRQRHVFVVRDRRVTEAAIVLDAADDGVHLFGLLDVARFVPLSENASAYLPHLLAAAARWYGMLGKHRFVYFEERAQCPPLEHPAARDLGLAHCLVVPIERAAEQIEHTFEVTAPRS